MQPANGLQGKGVVILGASGGGLAVAEQASSQGDSVVAVSSSPDRIQKSSVRFSSLKLSTTMLAPALRNAIASKLVVRPTVKQ